MAHSHAAALDALRSDSRRRMWLALAINLAMLAVALVGGILTGSLAALADAGHVLSDVGAIALGLLAATLAARPGGPRQTYGLRRTEILAALGNGLALVAIAVLVGVAALERLGDPPRIDGAGVLVVGALGLAGNAAATWLLARGDRGDINLEAVVRHSFADALGSLAVLVAGLLVLTAGWQLADPIAGLVIAVLILAASARLVLEPLGVLMESAPPGLDIDSLGGAMCSVPGVQAVHELHVWTVTSGFVALSAHVVAAADRDRDEVRRELEYLLRERYAIEHTTLQMEQAVPQRELLQVRRPPRS